MSPRLIFLLTQYRRSGLVLSLGNPRDFDDAMRASRTLNGVPSRMIRSGLPYGYESLITGTRIFKGRGF